MPAVGEKSPDGRSYWNGYDWVPNDVVSRVATDPNTPPTTDTTTPGANVKGDPNYTGDIFDNLGGTPGVRGKRVAPPPGMEPPPGLPPLPFETAENPFPKDGTGPVQDYAGEVVPTLKTPTGGEENITSAAGKAAAGPTEDETWGDVVKGFTDPSATTKYNEEHPPGMPTQGQQGATTFLGNLPTKTASNQAFAAGQENLSGESDIEHFRNYGSSLYGANSASEDWNYGWASKEDAARRAIGDQLGKIENTEDYFDKNRGQLERSGYTEGLAGQYNYNEPTYAESLYGSGKGGSNYDILMDRMFEKGQRRIDEAGAARGAFNSGASLRGGQELYADLAATRAEQEMALANSADAARLGHRQFGSQLMQGADTALRGRLTTGGQLASSADASAIERAKQEADMQIRLAQLGMQSAGQASDDYMARITGLKDLNESSSAAKLARTLGIGTLARGSDTSDVERFGMYGDLHGMDEDTRRYGLDATKTEDDINIRKTEGLAGVAGKRGDQNLAYIHEQGNLGAQEHDAFMDRILAGATITNMAGQEKRGTLADWAAFVRDQSNMTMQRTGMTFDQIKSIADAKSGLISQITDAAAQERTSLEVDAINGLLLQGQIGVDEAAALVKETYAKVGMVISLAEAAAQLYKATKGGK